MDEGFKGFNVYDYIRLYDGVCVHITYTKDDNRIITSEWKKESKRVPYSERKNVIICMEINRTESDLKCTKTASLFIVT